MALRSPKKRPSRRNITAEKGGAACRRAQRPARYPNDPSQPNTNCHTWKRRKEKVKPAGPKAPLQLGPPGDVGLGGLWGLAVGIFPDTESTTEGHATQGRGVLSVKAATLSAKQQAGKATPPLRQGVVFIFVGFWELIGIKRRQSLIPGLGSFGAIW